MAELLKSQEAADYLGVSASCLAQWRMLRKGPPVARISRRTIRYRKHDLDQWIESCVDANERPRG